MSHCLLGYISAKGEVPTYLIYAKKYHVECHMTGEDGHTSKEEGWAAHYDKLCDMGSWPPNAFLILKLARSTYPNEPTPLGIYVTGNGGLWALFLGSLSDLGVATHTH